MFDDIVSLGKASKKWEGDLNEIQDQLRHHQTRAQAAWGIVNTGPSHPDAVKFAEDSIKRHNPDIEQNFQDKVTRIKNAEQAERENDFKERMAKIDTPKRQSETVVLTR